MLCQVCGDSTTCTHYGGTCCMSCKAFFRRFARRQRTLKCRTMTNKCPIAVETRRNCASCRLNLCFAAGMKIEYVWTNEENREHREKIESKRRRTMTIERFHDKRLSLTVNQSTLVSNVIHHFDFINEQQTQELNLLRKSLPLKLRLKLSNYEELLGVYFRTGQHFVDGIPHCRNLETNYRNFLLNRSLTIVVAVNAINSMNLTNFRPYFDKDFKEFHEMFYGQEMIRRTETNRLLVKTVLDIDQALMKLFLTILVFTHLTCDENLNRNEDESYRKTIGERQNEFIELMWSYLFYRFENERTVVNLFTKLISMCLQIQIFIADQTIREENSAVVLNEMIEKTKSKLFISLEDSMENIPRDVTFSDHCDS